LISDVRSSYPSSDVRIVVTHGTVTAAQSCPKLQGLEAASLDYWSDSHTRAGVRAHAGPGASWRL
jgi:hypothetical protein